MNAIPNIVSIRRDSAEDGPGIRSVAFFKGCPLRCSFCHNPEAQEPGPQIAFFREKCIECALCRDACPEQAIDLTSPVRILRDRCRQCGTCAAICANGALRYIGVQYEPEELARLLLRDAPFFRHGGGVTLSGGEATMFPDYVESLLRLLKAEGVHVILETCGYFDYDLFSRKILPFLDGIFFDIKIADPVEHLRHTGKDNRKILENLRQLLADGRIEVLPRVPLIPGVTDTQENLERLATLLQVFGAAKVELLPYNPLGLDMYEALGREKPPLPESFPKPEKFNALCEMFQAMISANNSSEASPARDFKKP